MQCRPDCGACCIAPSITSPILDMENGKPAGVRCVHLDSAMRCKLFGDQRRPTLCNAFTAERKFCGDNREQALALLMQLEAQTVTNIVVSGGIK